MITIKKSANKQLESLCNQKETKAIFVAARESYNKNDEVIFASHMQTLITRIGLIMSEISDDYKIERNTFLGSIDYLCKRVIDEPSRVKFLKATSINDNGNNNKHELTKNEKMILDECVRHYNIILNIISKKYKLPEILVLTIKKDNTKNIFAEKRSVKYENLAGNKITFKLSPYFKYDKFSKIATVQLAVNWENPSKDDLELEVFSSITSQKLLTKRLSLEKGKFENLAIKITQENTRGNNEIDLYINVRIYRYTQVKKTRTIKYTTGKLLWKKEHYRDEEYTETVKKVVLKKQIKIAQTLREEKA